MTDIILKIYDFMKGHRVWCAFSFLAITLLLIWQVMTLNYKEDISDFLPLDSNHQNALKVYQDISGANKLFAIFQYKDSTLTNPDILIESISTFTDELQQNDSTHMVRDLMTQVDIEKLTEVSEFVYRNIPYFLTKSDYTRMDSLLADKNYISRQLQQDKQMLMFPAGGLLSENIQRDPLNLFTPIVAQLQHASGNLNYEMYDGHIFSPDMQRAIVMMSSPFGSSETENNSRLLNLLQSSVQTVSNKYPDIEIHIIGGPAIAVGNASQIKADSLLSVCLSVVLILALLFLSFRKTSNMLLIVVSIGWGWLFAMGCLALIHDDISVIVIGISSVILGIAVNYPLHLVAHLSHTPGVRNTLKEIIMPLVVGNITTVGAFLALVPLQSIALRDLGLFSSFLLIGTILFVMLYLPQIIRTPKIPSNSSSLLQRLGNISLESKPWLVIAVGILTIVFAYFCLQTKFDSNMGNINYMTDTQKSDMQYFQNMMFNSASDETIYVLSQSQSLDSALDQSLQLQPYLSQLLQEEYIHSASGCTQFLSSRQEQTHRLQLWQSFIKKYGTLLDKSVQAESAKEGFTPNSFQEFFQILQTDYHPREASYFNLLAHSVFSSNLSIDSINKHYCIVDILKVPNSKLKTVESRIARDYPNLYSFDVKSLNSTIADNLSDDFNYIGWACGLIVFFFLWFSLGNLELALMSFLPMAVSWVWILGLMALFGIQFNIVNVILATFIFGQGDDYTIFMTEGACYEYAYRKKMLASYKSSIILSALIMFIGIGTLIIAKHPALHSLAEVTIVGMFSVVLMAYLFPPLIFKTIVAQRGAYRVRPLSLRPLGVSLMACIVFFTQLSFVYISGVMIFVLTRPTPGKKHFFHRLVHRLFRFDMRHIPSVKFHVENRLKENFEHPAVIVCNHQSMLDSTCLMALSSKIIIIANENVSGNKIIKQVFRWLDFYALTPDAALNIPLLQSYVNEGYSLALFPEGIRNPVSSILRFHKGAFYLAEQIGLDIVPIFLHGVNDVFPRNSISLYPGKISVDIEPRITANDLSWGGNYSQRTKTMHHYYVKHYAHIATQAETARYYKLFVLNRYRYKGVEIESHAKKLLKTNDCFSQWIDKPITTREVVVINSGQGEFALLMALVHKEVNIHTFESDEDNVTLARYSSECTSNLSVHSLSLFNPEAFDNATCYVLFPTEKDKKTFCRINPIYVMLQ